MPTFLKRTERADYATGAGMRNTRYSYSDDPTGQLNDIPELMIDPTPQIGGGSVDSGYTPPPIPELTLDDYKPPVNNPANTVTTTTYNPGGGGGNPWDVPEINVDWEHPITGVTEGIGGNPPIPYDPYVATDPIPNNPVTTTPAIPTTTTGPTTGTGTGGSGVDKNGGKPIIETGMGPDPEHEGTGPTTPTTPDGNGGGVPSQQPTSGGGDDDDDPAIPQALSLVEALIPKAADAKRKWGNTTRPSITLAI